MVVMGLFIFPTLRPGEGKMKIILSGLIALALMAAQPSLAFESKITDIIKVGAAFATNLTVHEYGHAVVGNSVGAEGISVSFLTKQKNNLFIKENRAYTDHEPLGLPNGNQMATQVRLGKVKLNTGDKNPNDGR